MGSFATSFYQYLMSALATLSLILEGQLPPFLIHYTLAEGILISVRSLQRSEGEVSDPIKYIYS